jgi:alpha-mannosidase
MGARMAKRRIFVVPHTHYDAEVFLTRDVTLRLGSDHILDVLSLLDKEPDYCFVLDQRAYLEGFAALFPEQAARLREHIVSGRVEVAGGMHIMPDVNMPSGESFVRQITYGKSYMEETLNAEVTTGWMIDSFGHHPQVPQIMRLGGFGTYVLGRGMWEHDKAAFWWVGLDGTRIRCEWLPYLYSGLGMLPKTLPAFRELIEEHMPAWMPYFRDGQLMTPAGADLAPPDPQLPEFIRDYNASQDEVELVLATPVEYFAAQPTEGLEVIKGDLNPIYPGCYASRIALKQLNRQMENALLSAEKLVAVNWAQKTHPAVALDDAWEPVLFNQFHDVLCGCHVDEVYGVATDRYKQVATETGRISERALGTLTSHINTQGDGIPLVVVNLLASPRVDVAHCTIGLGQEKWETLALYDATGQQVPLQLEDVQRHIDGSIKRAGLLFIAEVPPLGYRTYFLREGRGNSPSTDLWCKRVSTPAFRGHVLGDQQPNDGRMGNGAVEVTADLRTGSIRSILLRDNGWNIVDSSNPSGFASVCCQEDRGDLWEYYGPLRGATTGAMPFVDPVPSVGGGLFSVEYGGQGWAAGGSVMAEMGVTAPLGDGQFRIRFRLYAGLPRVDILTELVNQTPFVRYRNVFPMHLSDPKITYEIPFGAIGRPEGEYPAQNWVDVADAEKGVALLNRGIPGHSLVGNVLTSSLLKCSKLTSYPELGGFSQSSKSDGGFEIGVTHRFEQAIIPHKGGWQSARLYHEGLAFNVPLIVRKLAAHNGSLPPTHSFLVVEPDNVVLHALYVKDNRLILRLAEAAGVPVASGQVSSHWAFSDVDETDLLGRALAKAHARGNAFAFTARPFEIKTFGVTLS